MATFLSGRSGGGRDIPRKGPETLSDRYEVHHAVHGRFDIGMANWRHGRKFKEGDTCTSCEKHLHQLHVCVPQEEGRLDCCIDEFYSRSGRNGFQVFSWCGWRWRIKF